MNLCLLSKIWFLVHRQWPMRPWLALLGPELFWWLFFRLSRIRLCIVGKYCWLDGPATSLCSVYADPVSASRLAQSCQQHLRVKLNLPLFFVLDVTPVRHVGLQCPLLFYVPPCSRDVLVGCCQVWYRCFNELWHVFQAPVHSERGLTTSHSDFYLNQGFSAITLVHSRPVFLFFTGQKFTKNLLKMVLS